jgi:ribosome-binding ATPase YchF (GTP1/OBG family)
MLWKKLMVNFTLPVPEVDPNEEDPNEKDPDEEDHDLNIIEREVKKWTLSKMATQFNNWKKRLDKDMSRKKRLRCSLEPLRR